MNKLIVLTTQRIQRLPVIMIMTGTVELNNFFSFRSGHQTSQ